MVSTYTVHRGFSRLFRICFKFGFSTFEYLSHPRVPIRNHKRVSTDTSFVRKEIPPLAIGESSVKVTMIGM